MSVVIKNALRGSVRRPAAATLSGPVLESVFARPASLPELFAASHKTEHICSPTAPSVLQYRTGFAASRAAASPFLSATASAGAFASQLSLRSTLGVRAFASHAAAPVATADAPLTGYYTAEDQAHYLKPKNTGDPTKRAFTYFVLGTGRFIYSAAVRLIVLKFIYSMSASADVLALASVEVDVGQLAEGSSLTVKWRGKPVFIRHRTPEEISEAAAVPLSELRHPETDAERAPNPKWLVVLGVCTHLGCVPIGDAGDYHGWFCPCHGSHYDTSGRIRKGPAPLNLEVPQYKFTSDTTVLVG